MPHSQQDTTVARHVALPSGKGVCIWSAMTSSPPWLSAAIRSSSPKMSEEPARVSTTASWRVAQYSLAWLEHSEMDDERLDACPRPLLRMAASLDPLIVPRPRRLVTHAGYEWLCPRRRSAARYRELRARGSPESVDTLCPRYEGKPKLTLRPSEVAGFGRAALVRRR